jgi:antirestriction protein ArdC
VRKGEHGTTICYADRFIPKKEQARVAETGETPEAIPFLKRFTVFNVEQCDGLPESALGTPEPLPEGQIIPRAEALIAATGADFRIGGARLLRRGRRLYPRAAAAGVFRADQLLPDVLS